jgi:hypothetical protein
MLRRLWRTIAIIAIAVCGSGYALVHHGAINQVEAAKIAHGVEQLRQLDFIAKVPLVFKTPDEAQQMMVAEIAREHSDEELRIGGASGAMTGLYPPGMDLKGETLKLLRSQIAGFYDSRDKQMVLVRGVLDIGFSDSHTKFASGGDIIGQMLLAHELTHALQDQHFHIEDMLQRVKNNDDVSLALKAVAEGDATLAGFGYVSGRLDKDSIGLLVSRLADLPNTFAAQSKDVPVGLSTPLLFQYSDGARFVGEAWRRGGWNAVDALYRNPPLSSQQIMDPALYFDHPSPPARIDLAGYARILKDWKKVDDDTYGELLLKIIFERNLPPHAPALKALPQWAGDRLITLQKNNALTLLWIIAFRDSAAAKAFAETYDSILGHLPRQHNAHHVETHSSAVLVAIGPAAEDFAQLAPAIWKASILVRVEPPVAAGMRPSADDHPAPSRH